jgi:hypothetical protein
VRRQKHHNGFDPVRHPDRDPISADQSVFTKIRGYAVDPVAESAQVMTDARPEAQSNLAD